VEKYWQLWNLPVHYWMIRHLYFPCIRAGASRNAAVFGCFLFSALLHELLVSVPFHMPRLYAFGAMLGQIPLVAITKVLEERWSLWKEVQAGNITFWISFCIVGQPMAVLLYYYDAHMMHQQVADGVPQLEVVGSAVVSAATSAARSVTSAAAGVFTDAMSQQ
jgi:diacylglycerol O-acyltransferase-1